MRRRRVSWLLKWLSGLLKQRRVVIYGPPGSCRTRIALTASRRLGRVVYLATGRHARLRELPSNVELMAATSFYDELLNVIRVLGRASSGEELSLVLDEFFANLVPCRAFMNESSIMRMALSEVYLLDAVGEMGGKLLLVCAEDPRTGGPLGFRYVRILKPVLLRVRVEGDSLIVEERDPADPSITLMRSEMLLDELLGVGSEES